MPVELTRHSGNDISIVDAARVSYAQRADPNLDGSIRDSDAKLLRFLMRQEHGTPFEMVTFFFRVNTSIAVAREWFRHRIGSFNEVSTRWKEMSIDDCYRPDTDHMRTQVGKPGAYHFEPLPIDQAVAGQMEIRLAYEAAFEAYGNLISLGVAREVARNVLPLGTGTEFIWQVNFRSLTNFLHLRTGSGALQEIRDEALNVERLITPIIPIAMEAWNEFGRKAI